MKVRDRYKMTELGLIPNEWEVKELNEVSSMMTNGFVGVASPYYDENKKSIPYLMSNNVRTSKIDERKVVRVTEAFHFQQSRSILQEGDLLTVQSGHIGTSCVVPQKYVGANCHALIITRLTKEIVNSYFVAYYINSSIGMSRLSVIFVGTTIKHVNVKDFNRFVIPIPPLPEQQRIAEILSSNDAIITKNDELIEKTKEIKQGMMQELLIKGIGHTEFKDSELGRIPKDWEVRRLVEISDRIGDGLHGTPVYNEDGEYSFINGNNLKVGLIQTTKDTKKVDEDEYLKYKKNLDDRTILISLNGTIGNLALYNMEDVVLSKSAGYINVKKNVSRMYIYYVLQNERTQYHFYQGLTGTTIRNLSLDTLRKTPILLPEIKEQNEIASVIWEVDRKLKALSKRKQQLEEIKQGLMQDLLTGRVRVNVN